MHGIPRPSLTCILSLLVSTREIRMLRRVPGMIVINLFPAAVVKCVPSRDIITRCMSHQSLKVGCEYVMM